MNRRDFLHVMGAIGVGSIPFEAMAGIQADVDIASLGTILSDGCPHDKAESDTLKVGIIGIGGAACCMLPRIYSQLPAELVSLTRTLAIDTSLRALQHSSCETQILLHAGRHPYNPQSSAVLSNAERVAIEQTVAGMHLVVIIAGMGGSVGSGLTPVVAKIAQQQGIVTVVAAVMPFEWEGASRTSSARSAYKTFLSSRNADALFQFSNDDYADAYGRDATLMSAPEQARIHISSLYRSLIMPIAVQGFVGVDLDDLRYILSRPGLATCAEATSRNKDDALETCAAAIAQPWLGAERLRSAGAVLVNIESIDSILTLKRYTEISRFMRRQCGDDTELFLTMAQSELPGVPFRVSVLVSGIQT